MQICEESWQFVNLPKQIPKSDYKNGTICHVMGFITAMSAVMPHIYFWHDNQKYFLNLYTIITGKLASGKSKATAMTHCIDIKRCESVGLFFIIFARKILIVTTMNFLFLVTTIATWVFSSNTDIHDAITATGQNGKTITLSSDVADINMKVDATSGDVDLNHDKGQTGAPINSVLL